MSRASISLAAPWPPGPLAKVLGDRACVIPVLGAGISVDCGLPSGRELAAWIRALPLAAAVDFGRMSEAQKANPLRVAQTLLNAEPGLRAPLHRAVATHLLALEAAATPTGAITALARTPNRVGLILTLNYDRLVEKAAQRPVTTLGVKDIPSLLRDGLAKPDGSLRVLHLHGSLKDHPDELVLDATDYANSAGSQNVRDLFTYLLPSFSLCIIGSSFEEQYLASILQAHRPDEPRHVIVCDEPRGGRIRDGTADLRVLEHNVLVCDYPADEHDVLDNFCEELVRCAPTPAVGGPAAAMEFVEVDKHYQPRRLVDVHDAASGDVEIELALGNLNALDEDALRAERRAVVVGIPGAGKSRLLEHLATSPRHGERRVLVRLRDVRQTLGSPDALLTTWIASGKVLDGEGEILADAVRDGSVRVHLLLDGLDELPRDSQDRTADALVRIGAAFPEHRFTISSRPSSALDLFPASWRQLALLCDAVWRDGFLRRVDMDEHRLSAALGALYTTFEPVLRVPFFLRGMLDLLEEESVPQDALELALALLRRLLRGDDQLRAIGPALHEWLGRVAVTMALSGSATVSLAELSQLATDDDLGDPADVAELLASRSLLLESEGRYAFQHRVFGESLVTEVLLDVQPAAWLDVLAPRAGPYSALRDEWAGVADLLLPRSEKWRAAVAVRDPRAAARATPPSAPVDERQRAARLLWDRAQGSNIWIDHHAPRGTQSDGAVVSQLIRAGGLETLKGEVRDALAADTRFRRGNAIEIVAGAVLPEAEALLRRVLTDDDDAVVRRTAASAAHTLRLTSLAGVLERRALTFEDEMEAGDLASTALALTPAGERIELGIRLLAAGNREIHGWDVAQGLGPAGQLRWLAIRACNNAEDDFEDDSWARERLDRIASSLRRPTRRQAAQFALAAAAARTKSSAILEFLAGHRDSAVGLIDALDAQLAAPYDIIALLLAVGSDALRRHGAARRVLDDVLAWEGAQIRRAEMPPEPMPVQPSQPPPPLGLGEVMAIKERGQRQALLGSDRSRLTRDVLHAPAHLKDKLIADLDAWWGARDLRDAVRTLGQRTSIERWAATILDYGPPLQWQLSAERWMQVALCDALWPPQVKWLRCHPAGLHRALQQDANPASIGHLAEVCGDEELGALVDVILSAAPGTFATEAIQSTMTRLADARLPQLLSQLVAHDPAMERLAGPHLAASGDVAAQRTQLEALIAQLQSGVRVELRAIEWLDAVTDASLFDLLGAAIPLAGTASRGDEPPWEQVLSPLQAAAERADPLAAVALYDRFIADPPWRGAQFLIERRDAAVQRLISPVGRNAAARTAQRLGLPMCT